MHGFVNIAAGFGRVRMPVENPFLSTCMEIAQRRSGLMARAQAEDGYIRDGAQNIKHLDKNRYSHDIKQIAALFEKLQHGGLLYSHCGALARQAATRAKRDPAISGLRADWGSLDAQQRFMGLRTLSRLITDILNESENGLCLTYPTLSLAHFPEATRAAIAMQVQCFNPPHSEQSAVYLMAINHDTLVNTDFDNSTAQLWHEHQHVYMSGLRDMLRDGFLPPDHPLYKEAYKSKTIQDYRIVGNLALARDIYYAEPEEKLCYFTQDIFGKVLGYMPRELAPTPAA